MFGSIQLNMPFPRDAPVEDVLEGWAAAGRAAAHDSDHFGPNYPQQQPQLTTQTEPRYEPVTASAEVETLFSQTGGSFVSEDNLDSIATRTERLRRTTQARTGQLAGVLAEHDLPRPGGLLHMDNRYASFLSGFPAQQRRQMELVIYGTPAPPRATVATTSATSSTSAANSTIKELGPIPSSVRGARAFMCPLFSCGQMFEDTESLRLHLRTHVDVVRQPYQYSDDQMSEVMLRNVLGEAPFALLPSIQPVEWTQTQLYNPASRTASMPSLQTSASSASSSRVNDIMPSVSPMLGCGLKRKDVAGNAHLPVARRRLEAGARYTGLEPPSSLVWEKYVDRCLPQDSQSRSVTSNGEKGWWVDAGVHEDTERGKDDENLSQPGLNSTSVSSTADSWEQTPNDYMSSLITQLLLSNRELDIRILDVLTQCQGSPSPYRDLIRLCVSDSSHTKGLSDIILCAMQQDHDNIVRQLDLVGKGRFVKRMLIKVSQKVGAVPSSLFMEGVSCAETTRREGMGGFADVFRGSKDGREVALKLLRISSYLIVKHEWKRPFHREALLWRQLRHENILEFIGLDKRTFDGSICMVSPWMVNGDITSYLANHDHEVTYSLKHEWILQSMAGLLYLHAEGVIHGDFRGANILLDDNLTVQIADFGLSMLIDAGMSTMGVTSRREGAVRWTAPEVLDSGQCTLEGDVYSFGCVCLEIFSETCPYPDLKNDRQVIHQIGRGRRPEWCTKRTDDAHAVVDALGNLAKKCWSDDPTRRPSMPSLVDGWNYRWLESQDLCAVDLTESISTEPQQAYAEPISQTQSLAITQSQPNMRPQPGSFSYSHFHPDSPTSQSYITSQSSDMSHTQNAMLQGAAYPARALPVLGIGGRGRSGGKRTDYTHGPEPHICDICERVFSRPNALLTHINSHTGCKPCKCNFPGCDRIFSSLSNMRRHSHVHD